MLLEPSPQHREVDLWFKFLALTFSPGLNFLIHQKVAQVMEKILWRNNLIK